MKLFLSAGLACLLLVVGCSSTPHDIVSQVPLGSKLSELDKYLKDAPRVDGEVTGAVRWPTKDGAFNVVPVNDTYKGWTATPEERDHFSGEVTFTDNGSTSSDVNFFKYSDGKLVSRDWGFLPG